MGILHLVNRSPGESLGLSQCLSRVKMGDAVLLLEGGVYAALKDSAFSVMVLAAMEEIPLYALEPDLGARGIAEEALLQGVIRVDYEGFVELTLNHSPIQSWS